MKPIALCLIIVGLLFLLRVIDGLNNSNSKSSSAPASTASTNPVENYTGRDDERNPKRITAVGHKSKELSIIHPHWELGGFNTIAISHITFKNNTDTPIGNVKYLFPPFFFFFFFFFYIVSPSFANRCASYFFFFFFSSITKRTRQTSRCAWEYVADNR